MLSERGHGRLVAYGGALAIAAVILGCFALGAGLVYVLDDVTPSKSRQLCDKEVEALLHSNDLVEVTRAGIIVNYLECGVSRRL